MPSRSLENRVIRVTEPAAGSREFRCRVLSVLVPGRAGFAVEGGEVVDAELVELTVGDVEEVGGAQVPLGEDGLTVLAAPGPCGAQCVTEGEERAGRGAGQGVDDDVDLGGAPLVAQVLCPGPDGLGGIRQREGGQVAERLCTGAAA